MAEPLLWSEGAKSERRGRGFTEAPAGYLDHLGLITLPDSGSMISDHSHWQPAGPAMSTPTHPSFLHLPRALKHPGFTQPFRGRPRAENEAMPSRPRKATRGRLSLFTANSGPGNYCVHSTSAQDA